jgi:hypothetical protein
MEITKLTCDVCGKTEEFHHAINLRWQKWRINNVGYNNLESNNVPPLLKTIDTCSDECRSKILVKINA